MLIPNSQWERIGQQILPWRTLHNVSLIMAVSVSPRSASPRIVATGNGISTRSIVNGAAGLWTVAKRSSMIATTMWSCPPDCF